MYLRKFSFRENAGQKIEWLIDNVNLGEINLVVGKNSSGKTRTLNALSDLVSMITGKGTTGSSCTTRRTRRSILGGGSSVMTRRT